MFRSSMQAPCAAFRASLSTLLVALICGPLATAQIEVPGDFADLQDAIDFAPAGSTIVIDSGSYAAITIDKSLTLVGRGTKPVILAPVAVPGPVVPPTITLAGPGSGVVTLSNLATGGFNGGIASTDAAPVISASGFHEVRILHCEIAPRLWTDLSGLTSGGSIGIQADVTWMLIADSEITGGQGGDDGSGALGWITPAGEHAVVSTGTVVVVDSVIRGGDGVDAVFYSNSPAGCPTDCDDVDRGFGGDAVQAGKLQIAGSVLQGGAGATLTCVEVPSGAASVLCHESDGVAIAEGTAVNALPGVLLGSGALSLGDPWELTWALPPGPALLLSSLAPRPGHAVGMKGHLFMNPAMFAMTPLPSGGLKNATFDVPDAPALNGLTVVLQTYSAVPGLSRPLFGTLIDD